MNHVSPIVTALLASLAALSPLSLNTCEAPTCVDADGDGYGEGDACIDADCDDANADIHPLATEICDDARDNDCDQRIDAADPDCGCTDADGDAYGNGPSCLGTDCDDTNGARNPGREEVCNDAFDNDCDLDVDGDDGDCPATSALELYPTIHSVGINVDLGGLTDSEGDARATFTYQMRPSGPVLEGFPFGRATGANRLSGAAFRLEPGASYAFSVKVRDPTTPALDVDLTGETATLPDPAFGEAARSYVVSPTGSGGTCSEISPCSLPYALAQVRAGEAVVMKGGVYYVGGLELKKSGTRDAPITLMSAEGEVAIWDGSDNRSHTWTPVTGYPGVYETPLTDSSANTNCVIADGVRLYPYRSLADLYSHSISCILALPQPAGIDGFYRDPRPITTVPYADPNPYYKRLFVKFKDDASPAGKQIRVSTQVNALDVSHQAFIHFRNLAFRYYGVEPYSKVINATDADNLVFDHCSFEHNDRGISISGNSNRNIIQYTTFHDDTDWDNYIGKATYETESPQLCYQSTPPPYPYNDRMLETGGVVFGHSFAGRGMIIRYNQFTGFFDGFKAVPPSTIDGYSTTEFDIYGNAIDGAGDDGLEVDGVAANVRLWENTLNDCGGGISLAPPGYGPVFLFNNVFTRLRTIHATIEGYNTLQTFYGQPLKFDCPCTGGRVYFFHNTVFDPGEGNGMRISRPTDIELFYSRNNILVSETNYALNIITHDSALPPLDLDFDLYFNQSTLASVSINGNPITYQTLSALTAAYGYEGHGLNTDPRFRDVAGGDFTLLNTSPAIDAGVVIPGINSGRYSGSAPDLGAFEHGSSPLSAGYHPIDRR